jgi:hypothetical protein
VELWAISSRGFDAGFDALVPPERRLALGTTPRFEGGNAGLLRALPTVVRWLKAAQPDWLAPHYLTSHGTLAWLAVRFGGVKARIAGSAWGSDILLTPQKSRLMGWLTRRVLQACALTTSDSRHMAERMRALGAREVMTFPFGLEALPPWPEHKDDALFFANRALEALYRPERVLEAFAAIAGTGPRPGWWWPTTARCARRWKPARPSPTWRARCSSSAGWTPRRKPAGTPARWYLSLPASDSVSVSVLEAMGHGCIPILSDLPANRELVDDGRNGLILAEGELPTRPAGAAGRPRRCGGRGCRSGWGCTRCSRTACRPMCSGSNNSAAGRA